MEPKFPNRILIKTKCGQKGLINWGAKPMFNTDHNQYGYEFNYGLGCSSTGYILESYITEYFEKETNIWKKIKKFEFS